MIYNQRGSMNVRGIRASQVYQTLIKAVTEAS